MRPKKYSISFVVETTMDQRTLLNAVHDYATNYLPELAVMVHDETLEPDERTVWVRCLSEDSKRKGDDLWLFKEREDFVQEVNDDE